jgi:hypothetical protein
MTPCYNVSSLRTGSKVALESRSPEPAESLSRPPTALPLISLISDSGSDSDLDSELSQLEEFLQEIDSTMLKIANSEDSPAPAKSSSRLPVAIDPISLISDLESDLDPDSDSDSQLGRRRQAFHQEIDSIMLDTDDSEDDHAAWVKHQLAFFDLPRPFGLSPDRSLISKESLESLGLSSDASSSTATGTGRYSCGSHSKTSSTSSPPGCRPWVNQW